MKNFAMINELTVRFHGIKGFSWYGRAEGHRMGRRLRIVNGLQICRLAANK